MSIEKSGSWSVKCTKPFILTIVVSGLRKEYLFATWALDAWPPCRLDCGEHSIEEALHPSVLWLKKTTPQVIPFGIGKFLFAKQEKALLSDKPVPS